MTRLHVGLNLVFLVPGETGGMETYARELIPRLAEVDELRLTAFVNREAAAARGPWGEIVPMKTVPVHARNRIEWVRGEQQYLPRMAAAAGCALVHSLASTAPLRGRFRRVTTIHDLMYKLVPDAHFGLRSLGMRVLVPAAARRSHRIVVDAGSTKRDLVEHLGVRPDRIDVVPLGVTMATGAPTTAPSALRQRLRIGGRPVLLAVGAKRPHKNVAPVIDALVGIEATRRPVLVVTGYPSPYDSELRDRATTSGLRDGDVVMPDWLSAEDLEGLYGLAAAVVVPSLYEGFGLPVLEAMARGVPVGCSNRSSLPEVAGDAAILFDPEDSGEIRGVIERLLGDEHCRKSLRDAGIRRAAKFTWERTAKLTARSYERALPQRSARGPQLP